MDVEISARVGIEPDESELRALRSWLLDERPRPGRVELVFPPAERGAMGALSETLQVALGTGGAATVLAGSLGAWLQTRREGVRLVLSRPDGTKLEIDGKVKNPDRAVERFLTLTADDG